MFSRARAAFASAVNMAAIALGLVASHGPIVPTGTARPPRVEPPRMPRAQRNAPRKRRSSSFWSIGARTQAQEMARRCRQIAAGMLTASNGLIGPSGAKVNSHGALV